ncbi:uncharacterized protein TRUGW13939_00045 [Talaromyces rugulosus]|uniref:Terpene synthase n=1 Tax=Talaromyces rugulosus TaxID=121627 RepID=A0A7H8QG70_TALRU|nr:uncharacterized protein TRUGW13939_00045 [Talaromyces rugulosus]QKX52974.1 hypothetical protein TRUGW13939_00045 [Talaromyces rugulosus]
MGSLQVYPSTSALPSLSPISTTETRVTRKQVLAALRTQRIPVPDLIPLFSHWPSKVSPELDKLRKDVDTWLNTFSLPSKALDAFRSSDFGHFGATWWPYASDFTRLRIVTYVAIWLFIWDDEIDNATGSMWEDWESAQKFRLDTIQYVEYCLGLAPEDQKDPEPRSSIIRGFEVIGVTIRDSCSLTQRKMVFDEMKEFMKQSEQEQHIRLNNDRLPSVAEFWNYRLGASAVFICLAINEYAYGDMELPVEIFGDADMKEIWQLTNIIISASGSFLLASSTG